MLRYVKYVIMIEYFERINKNVEQENLKARIYNIINDIPKGYVLTYGILANLVGLPNNSRLVARLISVSPEGVNSHRIVNSQGRTAPSWAKQRILLENEGVKFKENGNVDLKNFLWKPI